ncbi:MAG: heavy-metal-associated domain-containing protein [Acholeplasmataceae bacterium]|jgi:copper chaperone CopZ|nr:heavy-metal-associated domain-containing protein [Acholeplasmataceae bacterium]
MEKRIYIDGMACEHCAKRITKALKAVAGVREVYVNLDGKYADVQGEADVELLKAAVIDAGYEVGNIK